MTSVEARLRTAPTARPYAWESAVLRGARALERLIEHRIRARQRSLQRREHAAQMHHARRGLAQARGHLGMMP